MTIRHDFSPELGIEYKDRFDSGEWLDFYADLVPNYNGYALVRNLIKHTLTALFVKGMPIEDDVYEKFRKLSRKDGDLIIAFISDKMYEGMWLKSETVGDDELKKSER